MNCDLLNGQKILFMKVNLRPTYTIDSENERVRETAEILTKGCSSDNEKAIRLFYFVRDSIIYNGYMCSVFIEDFKASKVLEWKKGYCVQKAVLLTALGRASGIPSRLAFAKILNHRTSQEFYKTYHMNIFSRHGYNQFYLNDRWVSATATFDKTLCDKNKLPVVEFDGRKDATLSEKDLIGQPFIEYLEKYPPKSDLPFDWIVERLIKVVGPEKRPILSVNRVSDKK